MILVAGCDDGASASSSSPPAQPMKTTTLAGALWKGMDFDSLKGDSLFGGNRGGSSLSTTFPAGFNRLSPIAGSASARLKAVVDGDGYPNAWYAIDLDQNHGNSFRIDASAAKGIRMTLQSNKTQTISIMAWAPVYSRLQDDKGAQYTWRITVGASAKTVTLSMDELGYQPWLYTSGNPCEVDSLVNCPEMKSTVLSNLVALGFLFNPDKPKAAKDSVWLDIDDMQLVY